MNDDRNLATDADAQAAYDEPGSWGRLSEGWPSTPYTIGKWLLCTKAEVVPYGQYVVVGAEQISGGVYDYSNAVIRVASDALKTRLEKAYDGMFVECGSMLTDPAFRDGVLEEAATVCEGVTHWGMSKTQSEVAASTQRFCAKAIRAQKSDSLERANAEPSEFGEGSERKPV